MNNTKNSAVVMKIFCAIIFIVFTYFYLYNYQADLLAMAQHVLSNGQTVYNRQVGAILITAVLFLLQVGVFAITQLKKRSHALTYFPSLLVLAVITDISPRIDEGFSFGAWLWIFPLLIILYGGLVWFVKQIQPYEPEVQNTNKFFSKLMWINLSEMTVMLFLVGMISNHNDVFHYRMHMEELMSEGKYKKALKVGKKTLSTDSSLTCLRVICLEKTHLLGEKLFEYPVVGGSQAMKPNGHSVKVMMWRDNHVTLFFRGKKRIYPVSPDHLLVSYLLDKKLDAFVSALPKYYNINSKHLPKHYREALILYVHRRANPKIVYKNDVMEADFEDYQTMERKFANRKERQNNLHDTYGNTYWYYWQYE